MSRTEASAAAPAGLGTRTAAGVAWMGAQTIVSRVTSLLSQLALAYILMPEHFGQIGLVYTITSLATQITNPGVDEVLLQKQKHLHRWMTSAFWMNLCFSVVGSLIMVAAGAVVVLAARRWGNAAYGNYNLFWMILIMAVSASLNALSLVPMVVLRARLQFARFAAMGLGEILLLQGLTVIAALLGFGEYSFVVPMPIVAVAKNIVLWLMVRPRIRRHWGIHRWPSLTAATGWVFGQRILLSVVTQAGCIALGVIHGDDTLVGLFFFAYLLSYQVGRLFAEGVAAVMLPTLNAMHSDLGRMGQAAATACRALAAIVIPVLTLQMVLAGPLVRLLFAEKWEPSIPLLQWLSAGPMLYTVASGPLGAMLSATGRFKEGFIVRLLGCLILVGVTFPLTWYWSAEGTAIAFSIWSWAASLMLAAWAYESMRGVWILLKTVMIPLLAAVAAAIPGIAIVWSFQPELWHDLAAVAVATPLMLGIYVAILWLADQETVRFLSGHLLGVWRSVRGMFSRFSAATG